jgi:hypothetical protein
MEQGIVSPLLSDDRVGGSSSWTPCPCHDSFPSYLSPFAVAEYSAVSLPNKIKKISTKA